MNLKVTFVVCLSVWISILPLARAGLDEAPSPVCDSAQQSCGAGTAGHMVSPRQMNIAVVGGGTSGNAAVYYLKKRYGNRFKVTLFEERGKVGGAVTSTKWGSAKDWNQGFVDSGMIVSTRFMYPNLYAFLDAEGIPTEKRPMRVALRQRNESSLVDSKANFREGIKQLLKFSGTFHEFVLAQKSQNDDMIWFTHSNSLMWEASFQFMTLDKGSQTDHVAKCLSFLNISGSPHYEAPIGGYYRYSEKAASYADRIELSATVTSVKSQGRSGPVNVDFTTARGSESTEFDAVVLTAHPDRIKEMLPDFSVEDSGYDSFISIHSRYHGGGDVFYGFDAAQRTVNAYPNGRSPPYVTFFHATCDEHCRRKYVPEEQVIAEYPHRMWVQEGSERDRIARIVQNSGDGGVHFAGVWTGDGRFAEGAWVSGLRAAMEVAGEDWEAYPFSSECARWYFQRYAMWFKFSRGLRSQNLSAVPTDCYRLSGELPPYFDSYEDYDEFLRELATH